MRARRFVALGDSVTVGLGDPMPDGGWRGWAALLAESLAPPGELDFHNLAELGSQSHTLAGRQLPVAVGLRPTMAAVIVGVNDTLRGSFDIARTGRALETVVAGLRASGATVLTARLPDPGRMFGLPAPLARPLGRRIRAVNAVTAQLAARYGTLHLDLATTGEIYDSRMWSVDRLHPSERGHRLVAAGFADLLAARGHAVYRAPDREPTNPPPSASERLAWMSTKGVRWFIHRSGDLVPALVALAATDAWHRALGRAAELDQRAAAEVARALTALGAADPAPSSRTA